MRLAIFHGLPQGGAFGTLAEQVRHLAGNHEVVVYRMGRAQAGPEGVAPEVLCDPGNARRLSFSWIAHRLPGAGLAWLWLVHRSIARRIDEGGHDLVLVKPVVEQGMETPLLLWFLGTPHLYDMRSMGIHREVGLPRVRAEAPSLASLGKEIRRRIDAATLRRAPQIITVSRFMARFLAERIRARGTVRVHYGGVDTDRFRPLGLAREPVVLSAGRLSPLKGHDAALEVVSRIPPAERPALEIAYYNAGADETPLRERAAALGTRIEFHRGLDAAAMGELYNRASLTLVLSKNDALPKVILESMACATPVVATEDGPAGEIVRDGETGAIRPRDDAALAEAIRALLADAGRLATMGARAAEEARANWSWARSHEALDGILEEMAAARSRVRPCGETMGPR